MKSEWKWYNNATSVIPVSSKLDAYSSGRFVLNERPEGKILKHKGMKRKKTRHASGARYLASIAPAHVPDYRADKAKARRKKMRSK